MAGLMLLAVVPVFAVVKLAPPLTRDAAVPVAQSLPHIVKLPVSTPKQARLALVDAPAVPKLDMIERQDDGTLARDTYFGVAVDLKQPEQADPQQVLPPQAGPLAYGESAAGRHTPFDLVLNDVHPAMEGPDGILAGVASGKLRKLPVRGIPLNVSVTTESRKPAVRRLVAIPLEDEALQDIAGAIDVPKEDWDKLAREIGADRLKPGDRLELILGDADAQSGKPRVILARFKPKSHAERLLARMDDGRFGDLGDKALYKRMVAEALAAEKGPVFQTTQADADRKALAKAEHEFPQLMHRFAKTTVPPRVQLEIVKLLKSSGLGLSSGGEAPSKLKLLFRKTQDGKAELVSIGFKTAGQEKFDHFYWLSSDKAVGFFDETGHSAPKFLIHNPVPGSRMGDGFAWRIHPILKVRKFHNGVDFAAPMGSPILAGGDGKVIAISWQPGYGKYIRVQHDFGYMTTYAHISGTPKGLKIGDRVTQGEVIAYIGSTGLSTGPHLYYELRIGNRYANPVSTNLEAGTVLKGEALEDFKRQAHRIDRIANAVKVASR
jgi:murein DD-endopeptidase MepM/ murein hydrolase activator NlpD